MKKTFHKILSFIFALALLSSALVLPAGALPEDGGHAVYSMRLEKVEAGERDVPMNSGDDENSIMASSLGDVYRLIVSVETNAKLWWSNVFLTYDQTKLLPLKASYLYDSTITDGDDWADEFYVLKDSIPADGDAVPEEGIAGRLLGQLSSNQVYNKDKNVIDNTNKNKSKIKFIDPSANGPGATTDSEMEFNAIYKSGESAGQYGEVMKKTLYPDGSIPENLGIVKLYYAHNVSGAKPVKAIESGDLYEVYFRTVPGASADGAEFRFAYCNPSQDAMELDFWDKNTSKPKILATVDQTTNSPYTYTAPAIPEIEKAKSQVRFDKTADGTGVEDHFDYRLITSISKPLMTELKANQASLEIGFIAAYNDGITADEVNAAHAAIEAGNKPSAKNPKWFHAKGTYIFEAADGHGEFGSRINGISGACVCPEHQSDSKKDIVVDAYVKYTDADGAHTYWLKGSYFIAEISTGYEDAVSRFLALP